MSFFFPAPDDLVFLFLFFCGAPVPLEGAVDNWLVPVGGTVSEAMAVTDSDSVISVILSAIKLVQQSPAASSAVGKCEAVTFYNQRRTEQIKFDRNKFPISKHLCYLRVIRGFVSFWCAGLYSTFRFFRFGAIDRGVSCGGRSKCRRWTVLRLSTPK